MAVVFFWAWVPSFFLFFFCVLFWWDEGVIETMNMAFFCPRCVDKWCNIFLVGIIFWLLVASKRRISCICNIFSLAVWELAEYNTNCFIQIIKPSNLICNGSILISSFPFYFYLHDFHWTLDTRFLFTLRSLHYMLVVVCLFASSFPE